MWDSGIDTVDADRLLQRLDEDDLRGLVKGLREKYGDEVDEMLISAVREKICISDEMVHDRVERALKAFDDYIFFESNMAGKEYAECYTPDKASAALAEVIFGEFYGDAELMVDMGMKGGALRFIHAVAEGIRICAKNGSALLTGLAGDFALRYADILEESFGTDDILGGFGKK